MRPKAVISSCEDVAKDKNAKDHLGNESDISLKYTSAIVLLAAI